jgi:hypothetical protein
LKLSKIEVEVGDRFIYNLLNTVAVYNDVRNGAMLMGLELTPEIEVCLNELNITSIQQPSHNPKIKNLLIYNKKYNFSNLASRLSKNSETLHKNTGTILGYLHPTNIMKPEEQAKYRWHRSFQVIIQLPSSEYVNVNFFPQIVENGENGSAFFETTQHKLETMPMPSGYTIVKVIAISGQRGGKKTRAKTRAKTNTKRTRRHKHIRR